MSFEMIVDTGKGAALAKVMENITGARAKISVSGGVTYVYWENEEADKIEQWVLESTKFNKDKKAGDNKPKTFHTNLQAVIGRGLIKSYLPAFLFGVGSIFLLGVIYGRNGKR